MGIFSKDYLQYANTTLIYESSKVIQYPDSSHEDYITDLKYRNINIEICAPVNKPTYKENDKELIAKLLDLDESFKSFKKDYNQLEKNEFEKLLDECEDHGMNNIKSSSQLMSMVKISNIRYYGKNKYICVYNDGKNYNRNFFGGHMLTFEISKRDGKFVVDYVSFDG